MTDEKKAGRLDPNVAGAAAYVLGPVSGVVMLLCAARLVKDREPFVRFHAVQSIVTFGLDAIVHLSLRGVPVAGGLLATFFALGIFVLWVALIIKALAGQTFKLPFVGEFAAGQLQR
jgi:uncharacterized membrane protein